MKKIIQICIILIGLYSCSRNNEILIDVSSTDSLALSSQWAVIEEPYASYLSEAQNNSAINAYGRIGDVIEVTGSSIDDNSLLWYKFENGWLSENSIRIYANKLQADFAAKQLSE